MSAEEQKKRPRCPEKAIDRFSTCQKICMRTCLYGFFVTGVVGVFSADIFCGIAYLVFAAVAGIAALNCFCAHCPYPVNHDTCLAMPPALLRCVTTQKPDPLSAAEKCVFILSLAAILLIPQYWLIRRPLLLALYWLFCLPTFFVFPFYFCKRCRFGNCPFNQWT